MIASVREAHLFTYVIASIEMRFDAVGERAIYLRNDPDVGPVVRGEICGCGPSCHANLSQVLLEYALSCEGCQDQAKAGSLIECTGERLGRILANKLYQDVPDMLVAERITGAFQFVLQSMGGQFTVAQEADGIRYALDGCPLQTTAARLGLMRGVAIAYHGFVALCESMLHTLASGWALAQPSKYAADTLLREIVLKEPLKESKEK